MIVAVAAGRRIYTNLKSSAICFYSYSYYINRFLTFYFWVEISGYFTPVHVIFLELVMGPMCSIVYENEPAEKVCSNFLDN
jgi:Ca2+-transporting ATPase